MISLKLGGWQRYSGWRVRNSYILIQISSVRHSVFRLCGVWLLHEYTYTLCFFKVSRITPGDITEPAAGAEG